MKCVCGSVAKEACFLCGRNLCEWHHAFKFKWGALGARLLDAVRSTKEGGEVEMARIRTIKNDFFFHEEMATRSPLARLLFIGLWTLADKEGRLEDRPMRIKAQVLPWEDCDVDALLEELAEGGFIVRYFAQNRRERIWRFSLESGRNVTKSPIGIEWKAGIWRQEWRPDTGYRWEQV